MKVSNTATKITSISGDGVGYLSVGVNGVIGLISTKSINFTSPDISIGSAFSSVKIKGTVVSWKSIYAYPNSSSTTRQSYFVLSR